MRQSAVDLPDPLKQRLPDRDADPYAPPAPDPAPGLANADDLLAQLAGQEVDRLLAEARTERTDTEVRLDPATAAPPSRAPTARRPKPPAGQSPPPAASHTNVNDVLDDLFKQLGDDDPVPPRVSPGAPAGADLEQSLTARAQELIDQARLEAVQDPVLPAPAEVAAHRASFAAAAKAPPDAAPSEPASAAEALAAEMEEDARIHAGAVARLATAKDSVEAGKNAGTVSALNVTGVAVVGETETTAQSEPQPTPAAPAPAPAAQPVEPPAPVTFDEEPSAQVDAAIADDRESLLLRLLEWLNAPLVNLSDTARAALGKAAIATTVNALGILLYVLLFRR